MADERLHTYITDLLAGQEDAAWLEHIAEDARNRQIPIMDRETAAFVRVLVSATQPKRILEVGTAIGYSALVMAHSSKAQITTIERDPSRAAEARAHFQAAGVQERIQLIEDDAFDWLEQQGASAPMYDMILLDAAKGQYPRFLEALLPMLRVQGILLSDNVFFHGYVAGPETVKHKLRTLVVRLREYNRMIAEHPQLTTTFLNIGDGLAFSVKKGETT